MVSSSASIFPCPNCRLSRTEGLYTRPEPTPTGRCVHSVTYQPTRWDDRAVNTFIERPVGITVRQLASTQCSHHHEVCRLHSFDKACRKQVILFSRDFLCVSCHVGRNLPNSDDSHRLKLTRPPRYSVRPMLNRQDIHAKNQPCIL